MSEIYYVFLGIGLLSVSIAVTYIVLLYAKLLKGIVDVDERYTMMEIVGINRIAEKKGINLDKEIEKRRFINRKRKSLHSEIKREIMEDFFGKVKEEEKEK